MRFSTLREFIKWPRKQEYGLCMVISEQEGAEIWIDGKNTYELTPSMVRVPLHQDSKIELKLFAHETLEVTLRHTSRLNYYYGSLLRIPLRLVEDEQQLAR